jgi:CzcA family heavy metal efflux pump
MLTAVVRWSLHRPRLVAAAGAALFLLGAWHVRDIPVELFPASTAAQTVVQTEAPGLVAEQVEQLITRPLENVLLGAPGVAGVRSDSVQGLSVITLDLAPGGDVEHIRQGVSERLAQAAGSLPSGSSAPRIAPLTATTGELLQIGFTSDKLSPMQLRNLVQFVVRPRLLAAAGVANVSVYGGQTRRIEVRARPGDLSDSDLGFADVVNAVQRATSVAGAGFMDTPEQRLMIDPRGQALTADDVKAGQIQVVGSAPVRIGDVADVMDGPAPAFGDALIMGKPGVLVGVAAQYGADTLAASRAVQKALAVLGPALAAQGVAMTPGLDPPARFITDTVRGLGVDLVIGAALVALLLLMALRDLRAVLVSFAAIPIALLAALVVIKTLGLTLNIMTLGGLFVALGIVIDDAVIDVESIVSSLRTADQQHASRPAAVLAAVLDVRAPVLYATLLIDIALSPMLFLGGQFGAFLAPMALCVIVASLASLIVAACLTPALSLILLRHLGPEPEPAATRRMKQGYDAWIDRRGGRPVWSLLALGLSAMVTGLMLLLFHWAAAPSFRDRHLVIELKTPAATAPTVMTGIGSRLAPAILSVPGVERVSQRTGRDPTDFRAWGVEQSELDVDLGRHLSADAQDRVEDRLRRLLAGYPDVDVQIHRSLDLQQGAPAASPFAVDVFGEDLDQVDKAADAVAAVLRKLHGAGDVAETSNTRAPAIRIDLNFQRLAIYGLSAADVLDTVQTVFQGKPVSQVYQDGRAFDLVVIGPDALRQDPEGVGKLLLRSSSGVSVPLRRVANVYLTDGRTRIQHDAGQRVQRVTAAPTPTAAGRFARDARTAIQQQVSLPAGVYLTYASAAAGARASRLALLVNVAVAAVAAIGLLMLIFRDARAAILVLGSTLFAFVGGAVGVALTGGIVSLGALAGFIALFGLSTRNAILLVSRPHSLVGRRGAPWTLETVKAASSQRAAPTVLTALLVAAAVSPLIAASGEAGGEILGPMAVVIMCGAVTGAGLSLLFLPALIFAYLRPSDATAAPP